VPYFADLEVIRGRSEEKKNSVSWGGGVSLCEGSDACVSLCFIHVRTF